MNVFRWGRRDEERRAELVSRAVHFPDMEWDQGTQELAGMGRFLEPGLVPDEQARAGWKQAMLDEFDRLHIPTEAGPGPVVIADIEPVSEQDAAVVAERFAAMLLERVLEQ